VEFAGQRLGERGRHAFDLRQQRVSIAAERLRLLAPSNVLARGYSITTDARTGRVLRQADEARPGRLLRTQLAAGAILSVVQADDRD